MGKTATDAAADAFVAGLMVGFDRIADEKLTEKVDALEQRIVERLPKVVALPPMPVDVPEERLLDVKQVAAMLRCSPRAAQQLMDSGNLAYVLLDPSSNQRKVPYSWVVEYIHSLKRYTGKLREKKEVST
ncbi:hypothetical protein [Selenomonas sp. oral taxon 136]|uniref:hypothetical protein n=1 Tax=Selenomonas sp. oral taxon 136 TaxID=713030 RepID=UPI0007682E1E|nr:hypothetical protein [Selenomonas sp. oral taxon 136]AME03345.1 hypothetical protein AXE86_04195 [Selenomonas sp. oral taxon 136]